VAVAAFEQRLHLVAPPSADPAAIDAAFDELLRLPFTSSLVASERRFLDARIRSLMRESSFMPAQAVEEDARLLKLEIDRWADEELESQRRAIAGLRQLIGAVAALEGRKSVVVATRGATVDGDELLIKMLDAQLEALGVGGEMLQPNAGTFAHKQRVRDEFEAMVATAQDARVALYAVYPPSDVVAFGAAENASTGPNIAYMMPIDPAATDAAASVARMTGATGGASFLLGRNLDERLEAVRADADSVYSLGFTTGSEAGAGDHRIEVQVRGERLRVRHRESFRRRTPGELAERALYAAATLDEVRNPLGIELIVGEGSPAEKGHGDRLLAMAARVPLGELALLPDGDRRRGRLSFRVALLGERGDIFLSDSRTVPVDFAETDFEAAMAAAWVHRAEVRVKPSTRRLALLVVDEVAGVFATVTAAVTGGD
jgi:VWFA-related protein